MISGAALSPAALPASGGVLTITASVADSGGVNTGVGQVDAQIYEDGYQITTILLTSTGSGSEFTGTYAVPAAATMPHSYVAVVSATDKVGNQSSFPIPENCAQAGPSGPSTASIGAVTVAPATLPPTGGTLTITATATVPAGASLFAGVLINGNDYDDVPLTNGGSGTTYTGTEPIYSRDGTPATIVVLATVISAGYTLASALSNQSEQTGIAAAPPQISSVTLSPSTLPFSGGLVTVSAVVTDARRIGGVFASLSANSTIFSYETRLSNHGNGNVYTGTVRIGMNFYIPKAIEAAVTADASQSGSASVGSSNACIEADYDLSSASVDFVTFTPAALPVAGGTIHFSVNLTSQTGIDEVFGIVYRNGVPTYTSLALSNGGNGTLYTGAYTVPRNTGPAVTYTIVVSFYDDESNFILGASSGCVQQAAPVAAPPTISAVTLTPSHLPVSGGTITLSALVTAPAGAQNVTGLISKDGFVVANVPLLPVKVGLKTLYVGNYVVPQNFMPSVTYMAGVQVTDLRAATAAAPAIGTCVQDAGADVPATVSPVLLSPAVLSATGGTITIRATVIDPQGVSAVVVSVLRNGVSVANNIYLSNNGRGTVYTGTYSAYPNADTTAIYTADVYDFRSDGESTTGISQNSTVQFGDNQPPVVQSAGLSPAALGGGGGTLTVNAVISDTGGGNTGVQTAIADLFRNGVLVTSLTLAPVRHGFYSAAYSVPANIDADCVHWTAVIVATDFLNNQTTVPTLPVVQGSAATQPVPTLADVSPASAFAGGDVSLTLTGTGFCRCSVVDFGPYRIIPTLVFPDSITVTIPAADTAMPGDTTVNVTNSGPGGGMSDVQTVTLLPSPSHVAVLPRSVTGGDSATGTVTLSDTALEDELVPLNCGVPAVTLPESVLIPAGAQTATFPITTTEVAYPQPALITAQAGFAPTATLIVLPPAPTHIMLHEAMLTSGGTTTATVTLSRKAIIGGQWVSVTSSDPAVTTTGYAIVPGGETTASFRLTAGTITQTHSVKITATVGGQTASSLITVTP